MTQRNTSLQVFLSWCLLTCSTNGWINQLTKVTERRVVCWLRQACLPHSTHSCWSSRAEPNHWSIGGLAGIPRRAPSGPATNRVLGSNTGWGLHLDTFSQMRGSWAQSLWPTSWGAHSSTQPYSGATNSLHPASSCPTEHMHQEVKGGPQPLSPKATRGMGSHSLL